MRKMTVLLLTVMLLLFTSCDNLTETENEVTENAKPSPAEITGEIIGNGGESDSPTGVFPEMKERGLDDLAEYYFGIDLTGIEDASYWISPAGAYPDEVTVIKAEHENADSVLKGLREFFEEWVESRAEMWGAYNPAQARKLDYALIETNGDYIAVFICNEPNLAAESFHRILN